MPTVLRFMAYRFFFYSNEGGEPAHVHVERSGSAAKFWIRPVSLAYGGRFNAAELNRLHDIVVLHEEQFEEAWRGHFNS